MDTFGGVGVSSHSALEGVGYGGSEFDAFGDRTNAPIHARTLGPQNVVFSRENPHLEPRFPVGGTVGSSSFLCAVVLFGRRGRP